MNEIFETILLSIWDVRIGVSVAAINDFHTAWALLISTGASCAVVLPAAIGFQKVFALSRDYAPGFRNFFVRLTRRHHDTIEKYGYWGIFFIVAIPLPGTGPWTGAICTALLRMNPGRASVALGAGIAAAALFSLGLVEGVISLLPLIP